MRKSLLVTAVLIAVLPLGRRAEATQTYSSQAAFLAATANDMVITFNNTAGASDTEVYQVSSMVLSGVTFSAYQLFTIGVADTQWAAGAAYGSDYLWWQFGGPNTLTITFPKPVTAVGFNYAEGQLLSDVLTVAEGSFTDQVSTTHGISFLGLVSSTPFSTLTITDQNSDGSRVFPTIDNLTFETTSHPVPEPAPAALLGLAALLTGLIGQSAKRRYMGG